MRRDRGQRAGGEHVPVARRTEHLAQARRDRDRARRSRPRRAHAAASFNSERMRRTPTRSWCRNSPSRPARIASALPPIWPRQSVAIAASARGAATSGESATLPARIGRGGRDAPARSPDRPCSHARASAECRRIAPAPGRTGAGHRLRPARSRFRTAASACGRRGRRPDRTTAWRASRRRISARARCA